LPRNRRALVPRRRGAGDAMPTQIRFLGPDLPEGLILPIDSTSINIGELKERALSNWPAGKEIPQAAQLRIIFNGKEMANDKTLAESKVVENETTAMHMVIRSQVPKAAEASTADPDKGSNRCTCIIS